MRFSTNLRTLAILTLLPFGADIVFAQGPKALVLEKLESEVKSLDALYKFIHSHPELSFEEEKTAARLAKELKSLGFEVTTNIGGHGIVGVLKNGEGPTVMIRTDMDALPIIENTGLPYASKVRTRDKEGNEVGVMHACGHDMHMTCWVGTARVLAGLKAHREARHARLRRPTRRGSRGCRKLARCSPTACSNGSRAPIIASACTATSVSLTATSATPKVWSSSMWTPSTSP